MSNFFSKYLGKIALMAAAVLWAGCGDSNKKTDEPVVQKSVKAEQSQNAEVPAKQSNNADTTHQTLVSEKTESSADASAAAESSSESAVESSGSVGDNVAEHPKDSLRKKASRIKKVKSEIGMIRALYGVVEEDMGRAVALYGVRPPREIIMPDGPHKVNPRSSSSEQSWSSSSETK